ncbi:hypothetical protein HDV00_010570 [Rhizophlyctis rosea]|nr:hypothetical protein HDV00_010570 [Rhizophlyctis rosea]
MNKSNKPSTIDIAIIPAKDQKSLFYGMRNTPVFGVNGFLRIQNKSPKKYKNVHRATFNFACKLSNFVQLEEDGYTYKRVRYPVSRSSVLVQKPSAQEGMYFFNLTWESTV